MIPQVPQLLRLLDVLSAAGLGLLLALWYDLLRFFAGKGKLRIFLCDFFTFGLAALLLISFAVSQSYTGVFRWYMALGAACGYSGYLWGIAPFTGRVFAALRFLLRLPFRLTKRYILHPLGQFARMLGHKIKKRFFLTDKSKRKPLRKERKVLYNSNQ